MAPTGVQFWLKVGLPTPMASKWGKTLIAQGFKNPKTREVDDYILFSQKNWSTVLPITQNGDVLIVTEYKQGRDCVDDELPAGTPEMTKRADKSAEDVAICELREETGHEAASIQYLGYNYIATRNSPTMFHCFLATGCTLVGEPRLDDAEIITWRSIPLEEWLARVFSGDITCNSSIACTTLALPHLDVPPTMLARVFADIRSGYSAK